MISETVAAAVLGFIIDLFLADPEKILHPVVVIGRFISALERVLRKYFPKTDRGELAAGAVLAVVVPLAAFAFTSAACLICGKVHPLFRFALKVFWCWQALAVCGLKRESMNVYEKLKNSSLSDAQKAVARIVGRDTSVLDAPGVCRAAIETVAENFSDGVVAPLFYMLIGGAPLALTYKAVNTLDSMVGYKNEKYLFFGRVSAKLDDAANYIPARLAALFLVASAFFCRENAVGAWKIWRRDRRNHASPNSAQTESVMAGALGIRLAGPAVYFGKLYEKQYIGDDLNSVAPEHIVRADRMLYTGAVISLVLFCAVRLMIECR